ncbi:PH domain-containing protein [Tessaracoccus sp. HDW20]|uniref:PH domain-containing protein n=1 Tax=Tessaracoccus coleopterorum TaxID=2714950 RepID=UPI0018D49057|nr:PH domain-containing protein [Tessaracoccus coleopterorum]NHB85356.1 PH domain-containing protein [Tessaracoccus coleopterorum]
MRAAHVDVVLEPPPQEQDDGELIVRVPVRNLLLGALISMGASLSLTFAAVFLVVTLVTDTPVTLFASAAAIIGWLWSQTGRNWGFTMTRRGDALRIRRGLLSTVTQGLKPHRIQAVSIEQDILQRLTGLYQVSVTVLGYGVPGTDEDGAGNAVVLPFGTWEDVMTVLHAFWPDLDLSKIEAHPQPERARWLTPVSFHSHTWGIGEDVVLAQHGLITQRRAIVPHRRMQSASIEQGPLQRRLRLAEIAIHTTDGPVSLKLGNLDVAVARGLFFEQLERARRARLIAD